MPNNAEEKLNAKQRRAISALLSGANYGEAAEIAGVGVRTLYKWRHEDDNFRSVLATQATSALRDAATALSSNVRDVSLVPQAVALNEDASDNARLRAVEIVLSNLPRLVELVDVVERLEAVERILQGGRNV